MNIHVGKSFTIREYSGKIFTITITDIDIAASFVSYKQEDDIRYITNGLYLDSFVKWIDRGRKRLVSDILNK